MDITYKNLSWPIKTAVVIAWILGIYCLLAFTVGFIIGIVG